MKLIPLFLIATASLYGATCTSTASGNFRAISWTSCGGTYPHPADTAVLADGFAVKIPMFEVDSVAALHTSSDSGTGIITGDGTLVVAGAVRGGAADWTFRPGSTISYNGSSPVDWIMPSTGRLLLLGSKVNPITVNKIGSSNGGNFNGVKTWKYVKASGWTGFADDLTTAGQVVHVSYSVLDGMTSIAVAHVNGDAVWDIEYNSIINPVSPGSNNVVDFAQLGSIPALGTGKRNFSNNTVYGQVKLQGGGHTGLTVQYNKFYANTQSYPSLANVGEANLPVFQGREWYRNFFWMDRPSGLNSGTISTPPPGVLNEGYIYGTDQNCAADQAALGGLVNNNFMEFTAPKSIKFSRWIVDIACSYGVAFINGASTGTSPWTIEVEYTTMTAANFGTALLTGVAAGSGCTAVSCGEAKLHHNTFFGTSFPGVAVGGIATNHDPTGYAGMYPNVEDNIVYLPASATGTLIAYEGAATGQYGTVGHNWISKLTNGTGIYNGFGTGIYTTTPGTGDQVGDAGFVDPTRTFHTWCLMKGVSTDTACFAKFLIGTATYDANFDSDSLYGYITSGYRPETSGVATASTTSSWVGSIAPVSSPVLFYSDITSGPKTGGENNKGAYVCVNGANFGSSRGSSVISVGGGLVDNYPVWTDEGPTSHRPASAKACFQLGSNVSTGDIVLTTADGRVSNSLPFTVRAAGTSPDGIWCVSPASDSTFPGNDSHDGHFATNGNGGTGCKATWTAAKTAGFAAGDIVYLLGPVATTIEADTSDGTYAWYKLPGGNSNSAMPQAFLGYPGRSFDLGSNTEDKKIIGIGGTLAGLPGANWVVGNLSLRCIVTLSCLDIDAANRSLGNPALNHDDRLVNIKVQAPNADQATAGAITIADAYNIAIYGLEITNVGCGFGNTGSFDGSDAVNQSEQNRCTEYPLPYTISSSGTTITSASGLGEFTIGTHVCANGASCAAGQERIVTDAPSSTSLTINSPFSPDLSGVSTAHYVKPMSLQGGNPPVHGIYLGGMLYDTDFGWFYIHNNSAYKGQSQNPNQLGSAMVTSTTANSEANTGAALVTLPDTCVNIATTGGYSAWPCTSGDAVSLDKYDSGGTAIGTGYDATVIGSYYMKVVDQSHFYLYADADLSIPVTGATNCSTNCGWFSHGVLSAWGLSVHDGRVEYQNGPALSFNGVNPARGRVRVYNTVIAHTGKGPGPNGNSWSGSIAMQNLNFHAWYYATGISSGTIEVANNTFYDIDNYTSPDLGSGTWFSGIYGGFIANDHCDRCVYDISNNIVHSASSAKGLTALTSEPTYIGSKNLFYGGTFAADYGYPATPTTYQSSAVTCTAPCALFTDAANNVYTLASPSGPASSGGLSSSVASDLAGLTRPQGASFSIGAYEGGGATPAPPTCSIAPTSAGPYMAGQTVSSPTFVASNCASSTWGATGLSGSGLTLNSSTGTLSGTAVAGTYNVTITYDIASVPFTLTINAAGNKQSFTGRFSGRKGK